MYLYLVYIFIYYHDLFIPNRAQDENNLYLIRDNLHTYQFNCDDTSIKESFNQDYIINNSNTTLTKNDSNELVIIDYPYEFKKPKLPQLFIEKTDQPIHRPFSPFNIKQVPHKDIKSNSNDNNDLNNTLNDEYENRSNNNKQNNKESIDPNQMKTEGSYVTKESNVKNQSIIVINSRSAQVQPLKKIFKHSKTQRQKNTTTTNKPKALESHRCPTLQIKEKETVYCIYCEEMYKNCALNHTGLPLNKTCINCEKPICNEALELYKKNSLIEQYSNKSKTTRNTQYNHPPNKVASFIKSLTIVKGEKNAIIKVNRGDSSTFNSNNSSLIREKELFKKKYSFLHVQNQSINSNRKEKENEKEKDKEKDKSINGELILKENYKRGNNNNNNNNCLKKHCPMKLTMALNGKK